MASPYVTRPGWGRSAASIKTRERNRKRRWLADQAGGWLLATGQWIDSQNWIDSEAWNDG